VTATALGSDTKREIYLDRRVCSVTPDRIEVHPARSIILLPLLTLALGLAAFPVIYFGGGSLSVEARLLLTLAAVIIVPVSGLGVVYSVAGAHIVIDSAKQSAVLQQGYLGMGVGTQELAPFWKLDCLIVRDLTAQVQDDDFVQYEVIILKLSGRELSVGTITARSTEADEALGRANEVAALIAGMAGIEVRLERGEAAGTPS
jgi:hypothetical protein